MKRKATALRIVRASVNANVVTLYFSLPVRVVEAVEIPIIGDNYGPVEGAQTFAANAVAATNIASASFTGTASLGDWMSTEDTIGAFRGPNGETLEGGTIELTAP